MIGCIKKNAQLVAIELIFRYEIAYSILRTLPSLKPQTILIYNEIHRQFTSNSVNKQLKQRRKLFSNLTRSVNPTLSSHERRSIDTVVEILDILDIVYFLISYWK